MNQSSLVYTTCPADQRKRCAPRVKPSTQFLLRVSQVPLLRTRHLQEALPSILQEAPRTASSGANSVLPPLSPHKAFHCSKCLKAVSVICTRILKHQPYFSLLLFTPLGSSWRNLPHCIWQALEAFCFSACVPINPPTQNSLTPPHPQLYLSKLHPSFLQGLVQMLLLPCESLHQNSMPTVQIFLIAFTTFYLAHVCVHRNSITKLSLETRNNSHLCIMYNT